jgi:(p)ppGpp synthase/HD superfamily hydrolase
MLTHRFDDALRHAARLHHDHFRKGTKIPYISHLMAVSALVMEYGGDEDQAIAALLHDAVEDRGGMETARYIEHLFGPRVARIVLDCSDSEDEQKAPWEDRKRAYLSGIAAKSDDAVLVTACDKLHNVTAILTDLERHGPEVFKRFTAGRRGTIWYYRELARALSDRWAGPLTARLSRNVERLSAYG